VELNDDAVASFCFGTPLQYSQLMTAPLICGRSRSFLKVLEWADQYAAHSHPVLIQGETGVGKELFARRIHEKSSRSQFPFIPINCGALPPGLFESEMFGFERGAFSGATQGSRGLVRAAEHGTLFLDEIGDLDLALQVKLLRLWDSGEVRPLGSCKLWHVDPRIIAATNLDLAAAVHRTFFRQDLLERLSVLTLRIPPLRERREDIGLISRHLLDELKAQWEPGVIEMLERQNWPGNVRQLKNVLTRATVLGGKRLSPSVLDPILQEESVRAVPSKNGYGGSLEDIERKAIVDRLKVCDGNRKRAAKELGIAKSTLQDKLRKWREEDARGSRSIGGNSKLDPVLCSGGGNPQKKSMDV
jgi:transcriptional regulator with PAS, ATPase and Fis domain